MRKDVVFEQVTDPVGINLGAGLGRLDQENRELVATVAPDYVDTARMLEEQLADAAQRLVTHRVTVLVVDGRETVEVEQHHGPRSLEAAISGDLLLDAYVGAAALEKPRHLL